MRRLLHEGEQLICQTRPQSRAIIWPVAAGIIALGLGFFAAAWLSRGNASRLLGWIPESATGPLTGAALLVTLGILVFFTIRRFLSWYSTQYVLTSERLLIVGGFFGKITRQYLLPSISDVSVRQGFFQRPVRSGTITLELRHSGYGVLVDVPEVARFHGFILSALDSLPAGAIYSEDVIENYADDDLPWELREREAQ